MTWVEEIPVGLLEWAYAAPEAQPFGSDIRHIGTWSDFGVDIPPEQHEAMWSHIEAIIHAARHAGRSDLLLDLPIDLARRLRLVFSFELSNGQIFSLGPEQGQGCMDWSSFLEIYQNARTDEQVRLMKDLVEVFGISPEAGGSERFCASCGAFSVAFVETVDDSSYCRGCWSDLLRSCTVPPAALVNRSGSMGKSTRDDHSSVGTVQRRQLSVPAFSSWTK